MPENNSEAKNSSKIRIVTSVLSKALELWLRSQVSQVSQLEVEIKASDRQILSGCIPSVSIFASNAVYQGLHITQIQLVAESIRINIGSVLKGQSLRLLETVPVAGQLTLLEEDLNASLNSALLSTALNDVLVKLVPEHSQNAKSISWQKITLDKGQLILTNTQVLSGELTPHDIYLSLELISSHELQIAQIEPKNNKSEELQQNQPLNLDLGNDVDIQELTLIPGKLVCHGRINVNP
jgi:LmeA-like phospholipid-binding